MKTPGGADQGAITVPHGPEKAEYFLRLFITGQTPRSTLALENIRRICNAHLAGHYRLEVIDIYQEPDVAAEAQIIAAPTLIRVRPEPLRRIIGDLSDGEKVLSALDIKPHGPAGHE